MSLGLVTKGMLGGGRGRTVVIQSITATITTQTTITATITTQTAITGTLT